MDIETILMILVGAIILIGAVQCFFGYRLLRTILTALGFILGALTPILIIHNFMDMQTGAVAISALIGGIIGALLAFFLYYIGIFFLGVVLGSILGYMPLQLFNVENSAVITTVILLLGLAGGVLSLIYKKWVVIVSTGVVGAFYLITGVSFFMSSENGWDRFKVLMSSDVNPTGFYTILIITLLLGLAGIYIQHKYTATIKFTNRSVKNMDEQL